jgi:hypothetical protein
VSSVEPYGIVRSSARCEDQPCSWVRGKGRDKEKEEEDMLVERS